MKLDGGAIFRTAPGGSREAVAGPDTAGHGSGDRASRRAPGGSPGASTPTPRGVGSFWPFFCLGVCSLHACPSARTAKGNSISILMRSQYRFLVGGRG
jgi:hypothetical protein